MTDIHSLEWEVSYCHETDQDVIMIDTGDDVVYLTLSDLEKMVEALE